MFRQRNGCRHCLRISGCGLGGDICSKSRNRNQFFFWEGINQNTQFAIIWTSLDRRGEVERGVHFSALGQIFAQSSYNKKKWKKNNNNKKTTNKQNKTKQVLVPRKFRCPPPSPLLPIWQKKTNRRQTRSNNGGAVCGPRGRGHALDFSTPPGQ